MLVGILVLLFQPAAKFLWKKSSGGIPRPSIREFWIASDTFARRASSYSPSSTWILRPSQMPRPERSWLVSPLGPSRLTCRSVQREHDSRNRQIVAIERGSGTGMPVFVHFLASVVLSLRDRARSLLSKLNSLLGSE